MNRPPPDETTFISEYDAGHKARIFGKSKTDNPYPLSVHDRDTTFSNEQHYFWNLGYSDAESLYFSEDDF